MSQVVEPNLLAYATGPRHTLSPRAWRILFWVSLIHFVALITMLTLTSRGFMMLWEFMKDVPKYNWFIIGLLINNFSAVILLFVNALAVMGYRAGVAGRSTLMVTGLRSIVRASCTIGWGSVADRSNV